MSFGPIIRTAKKHLRRGFLEASRVSRDQWESPSDIKNKYPHASILPDNRVVFNIKGNNYRLVVKINYDYGQVFIRFVGTHIEEIFNAKPGNKEGDELEILGILVDEYEKKNFPINAPKPVEAIKFRMDQLGIEQKKIWQKY